MFLWGGPGIGKSQAVEQIAKDNDMGFIDLRLAQLDPVDLRGPLMQTDNGRMEWLTPSTFPLEDDEDKGIIFLDELNLAPTSIQNTAYQLVFKKEIGNYKLPDGWNVIAAGNKEQHAQVHSMQPPLRNRLFHMEVRPDLDTWKEWAFNEDIEKKWAVKNRINPMVLAFLSKSPNKLYQFDNERDQLNFCSPRSWEMVSYLLDTGSPYSDLKGAIGEAAASEFTGYLRVAQEMPDIDTILEGKDIIPERPDIKYAVAQGLISRVKDKPKYLGRLFEYAIKLGDDPQGGTEFAVLMGRDALKAGLEPGEPEFGDDATKQFKKYADKYKESIKST